MAKADYNQVIGPVISTAVLRLHMRLIAFCMLVLVIALSLFGCQRRESSPDNHRQANSQTTNVNDKTVSDSNLAARFDAASSMNNVALKDDALVKLANDSGSAGDGEIAKKSIDSIQNVALHDEAAYDSALLLAKSGDAKDAVEIAKSINNVSKRDEALAKITKGETNN